MAEPLADLQRQEDELLAELRRLSDEKAAIREQMRMLNADLDLLRAKAEVLRRADVDADLALAAGGRR